MKKNVLMATIVVIVVIVALVAYVVSTGLLAPAGQKGKSTGTSPPFIGEHFIIVAGEGGTLTFNGTTPGPALSVPVNTEVWVTFEVSPQAGITHSWVLVPENATASTSPDFTPVFKGASTPNPTQGQSIGSTTQIYFNATVAGDYKYICEVPGHFDSGMWGWFNVTAASAIYPEPAMVTSSSQNSAAFPSPVSAGSFPAFNQKLIVNEEISAM